MTPAHATGSKRTLRFDDDETTVVMAPAATAKRRHQSPYYTRNILFCYICSLIPSRSLPPIDIHIRNRLFRNLESCSGTCRRQVAPLLNIGMSRWWIKDLANFGVSASGGKFAPSLNGKLSGRFPCDQQGVFG